MNNIKEVENILKSLGNRRRLEIIRLLRDKGEHAVGMIAEDIGLSIRSTSRHLAVLRSAGILDKDQRGLEVWYRMASGLADISKTIISFLK